MVTPFEHGILATPNIGGALGFGWKSDSKSIFVDGSNGGNSKNGSTPDEAVATINKAISLADAWDVIYINPKNWTSGNLWLGTSYQDTVNLSIPYAKQGLAMVGIGHQGLLGPPYGTVLTEVSASTEAILKVHAPMCAVENLTFYKASTAVNGVYFYGDVAGTSEAALGSVYNCHFHGCTGSSAQGSDGGAVYGHAVWGLTVDSCNFMNCGNGISFKSDAATAGKFVARNNEFTSRLTSASDIGCDVYVYTQGSVTILIRDNYFAHLIPSLSSGSGKWISVQADIRQGLVTNNHCGGVVGTTYTQGYNGTGIQVPSNVGLGANYCNGQIMPVVSA